MAKKAFNTRDLHKIELEYLVKESCGALLLELDEDCVITGINPNLDEISLMNQVDFVMKKVANSRDDAFIDIDDIQGTLN
jgi:hypothetical protein